MKQQGGKSPLGWIITIAVVLIIAGVAIAMIFGDAEEIKNTIKEHKNTNSNNAVQTQAK